ncbi:hypothetical protein EKO04_001103 [Ascochyta lentis]|uniref:F-box domain-containing protein n=1 Tax=Ascochyta lentis TaxID=205686 RepID=A0A8H7MLA7_9PLEO|nr:hypothetical protein EKO04_001103 [Ascochyta lentis]
MASIFSLSTELIDSIAIYLATSDIEKLTRTCRSLHKSARPALYRTVTLDPMALTVNKRPRIICLLRSFMGRPELSSSTRNMVICGDLYGWTDPNDSWSSEATHLEGCGFTTADKVVLVMAMVSTQLGALQTAMIRPVCEVITMVMLAHCTRVRTLSIPVMFLLEGPAFQNLTQGRVNTNSAKRRRPFNRLDTLTLTTDDNMIIKTSNVVGIFSSCFALPKLSALYLSSISMLAPSSNHSVSGYATLHIAEKLTTLHLHRSQIPASAVEQILQRTPRLTSFVFDYLCSSIALDLDRLHRALGYVQSTLEDLTVRITISDNITVENLVSVKEACEGKLGSFKSFTALKKLSASFPVFFGKHMVSLDVINHLPALLPPHLEHLLFADDLWDLCGNREAYSAFCTMVSHEILREKIYDRSSPLQKLSVDFRRSSSPLSMFAMTARSHFPTAWSYSCSEGENGYVDVDVAMLRSSYGDNLWFDYDVEEVMRYCPH